MPRDYEHDAPAPVRAEKQTVETTQTEQAPGATAGAASPPPSRRRRRLPLLLLGAAILGAAAWYGHGWWTVGRFMVETDDAYVKVDYAVMAPKVSGYVGRVLVAENANVRAGDPMIALDDGDYRNALQSAEAQIAAQRAALVRVDRQIEAARAAVAQTETKRAAADADAAQAEADYVRYSRLAQSDFASGQKLDAARAAKATAEAAVAETKAGVISAKAQTAVIEAQRAEVEAALAGLQAMRDRAARDLAAATIRAPFDGVVGNLAVAAGDYVTPGKRLLAVVPLGAVYVEANFKETQLERLEMDAPVRISVDAYPDRVFTGRVVSMAPASGAVFSLLPPENATGNFTKVVQRVPVRISVPAEIAAAGWLRPGLSVTATADSRGDAQAEFGLAAAAAAAAAR